MKKIVISLLLVIALLLTGCSCTPETSLSFTSAWAGGDDKVTTGYKETCVYSVELIKDFNEDGVNFSKNEEITKDVLDYEYQNGTYTTTLEVLGTSEDIPGSSDINLDDVKHIIHFTAKYKVNSKFRYGDTAEGEWTEENEDFIESDVYFCEKGASYTPLYSITKAEYSVVQIGEEVTTERVEYQTETSYSTSTYSMDGKEYEKTFKTYIDNNQLLFALRNINIDVEGTFTLPTVAVQYGSVKNLSVKRMTDISLEIGESNETKNIDTKRLSFRLESTLNAGKEQLVYINSDKDHYDGKAVLVRYVAPLGETGSFLSLGAMQYTLTSFSVN